MAQLKAKKPTLKAVREMTTNRNLLEEPDPLVVDLRDGIEKQIEVEIENGPENYAEYMIESSVDWLRPVDRHLNLLGGQKEKAVLKAVPTAGAGYGQFFVGCEQAKIRKAVLVKQIAPETPTANGKGSTIPPLWAWVLVPVVIGLVPLLLAAFGVFGPSPGWSGFLAVATALVTLGCVATWWLLQQAGKATGS
jgi:hypothetical protein